jgi:hypothetical protein
VAEQTISIAQAVRLLQTMRANVPKGIRLIARRIALDVIRESTKNVSNDLLMVRTGTLRRYITATLTSQLSEDDTGVRTGLPKGDTEAKIARVHDEGATIRPTMHQFLRVPLQAATTSAGVDRYAGLHLCMHKVDPPIFAFRSKAGKLLLGRRIGEGKAAHLEVLYALVPQVTLKARHWWTGAVKAVQMRVPNHIETVMRKIIQGEQPAAAK